jgi:hypothetical protein
MVLFTFSEATDIVVGPWWALTRGAVPLTLHTVNCQQRRLQLSAFREHNPRGWPEIVVDLQNSNTVHCIEHMGDIARFVLS